MNPVLISNPARHLDDVYELQLGNRSIEDFEEIANIEELFQIQQWLDYSKRTFQSLRGYEEVQDAKGHTYTEDLPIQIHPGITITPEQYGSKISSGILTEGLLTAAKKIHGVSIERGRVIAAFRGAPFYSLDNVVYSRVLFGEEQPFMIEDVEIMIEPNVRLYVRD